MKFTIRGRNREVTLTQNDFLSAGGEGKVFVRGSVAYKLCDTGKMIPDGKFKELSILTEPHIIRPEDILLDGRGHSVGYTMKYVKDTVCLCQLFTKAFRRRAGIDASMMLKLVRQMQETIQFIHDRGILIVDLNEMNFLVDEAAFKDVFFIDVNSYQTQHYPATAIMDSIRDRHCNNNQFSTVTDWFSFAIVSFQMMIGIHPFKGKHPSYTDVKTALDGRMLANISILNPKVSYPTAACQPLSDIPDVYLQWYKAVFDRGERLPPPADLVAVVHIAASPVVTAVSGSNTFMIKELAAFSDEILDVFSSGCKLVIVGLKHVYVDGHQVGDFTPDPGTQICFTPKGLHPIAVSIQEGHACAFDLATNKSLPLGVTSHSVMSYDSRCYILGCGKILELRFVELGSNVTPTLIQVGNILDRNTKVFDGVIVQTLFDAYYFSVFPESGRCYQFALRELDGYKIVAAKFERCLLQVVGIDRKTGNYDRFVFWTADDWAKYNHLVVKNITFTGLNFTVLDNGRCIQINEDENVEVFLVSDPSQKKEIRDLAIDSGMKLFSDGSTVMFSKGGKISSIAMARSQKT